MIFLLILSSIANAAPVLYECNGQQVLIQREKNDDLPQGKCIPLFDSRKDGSLFITEDDLGFVSVSTGQDGKKKISVNVAARNAEHTKLKEIDDAKKQRVSRIKELHAKLKAKDPLTAEEQQEMLRLERGL